MLLLKIFHQFKKSFKVIPGVFFLRGFIALQNHFFQPHLKDVFCVGRLINLPHPDDCVDTLKGGWGEGGWWIATLLLQPSLWSLKAEVPAFQMSFQACGTFASRGSCLSLLWFLFIYHVLSCFVLL